MAIQPREVSGPLFLPQLTELLSPLSTRQITYLVRKREKELDEKIFLGGGKGSPLYLTIPLLSKYFPEFVDDRFAIAKLLKDQLEHIDTTQTEMKKAIVSNRRTITKLIGRNGSNTSVTSNGSNTRSNSVRRQVHQGRDASYARTEGGGYKRG